MQPKQKPIARAVLAASVCVTTGCGGGAPLLHSTHALPPGRTAFAAGMSDRFVLGAERAALDDARQRMPGDTSRLPSTRGLLVALAEGPALAPYASARVGIVGANEAGLSYSGQALRADARHAFESAQSAFSVGLGLTGRGFGRNAVDLPGTDLDRITGVGVDLPLLFGYRSDADLVSGWVGLRGSLDHWSGKVSVDGAEPTSLRADRLAAGPLLGLAVGLPPFWVAAEVELDYSRVTGTMEGSAREEAHLNGWSMRPAGALIAKF